MNDGATITCDGQWLTVGDRRWPVVYYDRTDYPMNDAGDLWRTRRARLRFECGYAVSAVWGDGTYSTNHHAYWGAYHGRDVRPFTEAPTHVEVGLLNRDDDLIGDPAGYVDAVALAILIDALVANETEFATRAVRALSE